MDHLFNGRTLNFAHRGASLFAPENTLAAFKLAQQQGVDGIELDVRLCRTGEWVVIHDSRVNRTTNGRGYVRSKSIDELRHLDAGSSFHPHFANERIPTLAEVLDWARNRVLLNIEVKSLAHAKEGAELRLLSLIWRHGVRRQCLISSFNPIVLRRLARLDPGLPTGLLLNVKWLQRGPEKSLLRLMNVQALHISRRLARPRFLDRIHRAGLRVFVWGVNHPTELQHLVDWGVDGIITDVPHLLNDILRRTSSR
ncbi:MAG: glycerophosphodiester phosphodiesterase family protein [candidate division KSB1 bacterium]|nr:glycerophosphodiester phosphodiesterase family protein [candidate division KSB1 bacterium]MDZ7300739.1 glycerophosphodiester phosphodiesterase family protein [candidate division KSB1 bacterium]MDZ7309991.1 glycerophosphodiester phosphodiesterase family protein [candidate division KSB1 bacterium]